MVLVFPHQTPFKKKGYFVSENISLDLMILLIVYPTILDATITGAR